VFHWFHVPSSCVLVCIFIHYSTGTNCPHDISSSLEVHVRTRLPRSMSP
jgi:hypothetical protein